jgi:5-methylcytosine-specific restriction endonuclease McrA
LRLKVLWRDKWTCQMPACLRTGKDGKTDRRINRKLRAPDPWSATVDHVIPRSLGGPSRMSNLRAAHLKCNGAAAAGLHDGVRSRRRPPGFRQEPAAVDGADPWAATA